jgi:dTDP-4-dehydrorhamnose reductase
VTRVLLCGAGGMLASDVRAEAPGDVEVISRTHAELDVTDAASLARIVDDTAPQVIINCSGYTNVDRAESERAAAFRLNGEAPGIIGAAAARHRGCTVVHFSTDYVFNGRGARPYRAADATDPVNAYGASKLAGERALAASGASYVVIRTSWLFGLHGRSFPRTMWERAAGKQKTKVANDQRGRPTYTLDLARATWALLRRQADGTDGEARGGPSGSQIVHVANAGHTTWYEIARRVFRAAGAEGLLTPCTTAEYPTPARRPAYSVLDTAPAERLVGGPLPPWEDAVDRFLEELARA